jgi:hypothetical protein
MKIINLIGLKKFGLLSLTAALFAIWAFMPGSIQKGSKVYAGCTMAGAASYVNGVPTCDCTTVTPSTCACVVTCPKGGGEFEEEEGAN